MKSKEQKRTEAMERQMEHDALSVDDKIVKACFRRGRSDREVARLRGMKR